MAASEAESLMIWLIILAHYKPGLSTSIRQKSTRDQRRKGENNRKENNRNNKHKDSQA
jgi:hypothetical protein